MPGRKDRNILRNRFHDFTLKVRLVPPGLFSMEDPPSIVLPVPESGLNDDEIDLDFLMSGRAASKVAAEVLTTEGEFKDISIRLKGNILELCVDSLRDSDAYYELVFILGRLLRLLTARIGQSIGYEILSFRDEREREYPWPRTVVASATFYDLAKLSDDFAASVAALALDDEALERALYYFSSGCKFYEIWADHLHRRERYGKSEEGFETTIWASAFLQFWKAITVILDEPTKRTKIFRGRVKALGLAAEDRQILTDLYIIRNDFDVSHRSIDRFSGERPRRNVGVAQGVAERVIEAYQGRLRSGKPPFGPHPLRVGRLRRRKASPLSVVAQAPKLRMACITVAVEGQPHPFAPMVRSGMGRDIFVQKFSTARPPNDLQGD